MRLIKVLIHRRIPHIIGSYLIGRVKINQVFDSTATATIYKPKNPHTKINTGDYILY